MAEVVEAVYEHGVLRLSRPLEGIPENSRVNVTVQAVAGKTHPLKSCIGTIPEEDAYELLRIVDDEFEKVAPREWE